KPLSRFHQISQRSPFTNIVRFQLKRHKILSEFPKEKRLLKKKSPTIVLGTLMEMEIGRRLWNLRTAFLVRVAMNLKKLQQLVDNILEGRSVTSRKFHMKRMYKKKLPSQTKPAIITLHLRQSQTVLSFLTSSSMTSAGNDQKGIGLIWSLNCKEEGLPNYYTRIQKVEWKPMFKLQINKLKLKSLPENATQDKRMPVSCGKFTWKKSQIETLTKYTILPKTGDSWAMYTNWSDAIKVESMKKCTYEVVESHIEVLMLERVHGLISVFKEKLEGGMDVRRTISRSELLSERGGAPMGYIKLDSTAASPIKRQEQDLSMGEVEFEATKKKAEEFKTSKKKEKKKKMKRFKISIRKAYLEYLRIPNIFQDKYIKSESSVMFKIHHAEGKGSWNVLCVVKKWHATFSKGWSMDHMYLLTTHNKLLLPGLLHCAHTNVNVSRNCFTNLPKPQAPQPASFSESQTAFLLHQLSRRSPSTNREFCLSFPKKEAFKSISFGSCAEKINGNGKKKKIDNYYFEEVAGTGGHHSRKSVRSKHKVSYEENECDDGKKEENNVFAKTLPNGRNMKEKAKDDQVGGSQPDCIIIPNFEFHDFSEERSERKFTAGQILSLNCKEEGLPKYYTKIQKIDKLKLKSLHENATRWMDKRMSVSCGKFTSKKSQSETHTKVIGFSHLMEAQESIHYPPQTGDIWAMYTNWSDAIKVRSLKKCAYEVVDVFDDDESNIEVMMLDVCMVFKEKVEGGMNVRRTILRSELLRFSHYVPAFRLTSERGGAPRGYYELDSAVVSRIKRQEQDASMEGIEFETTKKKAEESKTSKKKKMKKMKRFKISIGEAYL
ncbi:LOW QUALITY PROTEIN: hypothetical protein HID58_057588, partial [Brassica napus]